MNKFELKQQAEDLIKQHGSVRAAAKVSGIPRSTLQGRLKFKSVGDVSEVVTAFKGFDSDLKCRGYQFEIGKTHFHSGEVKVCKSGFHSCENPLDVLNYYPLIDDDGKLNRFATVKASGSLSRHSGDSKVASATLTVEAELKIPELIRSAINWTSAGRTTKETAASGYNSRLAASGNSSHLAASGYNSQLAASGNSSIAIAAAPSCTASVGKNGCIVLTRWVESEKRYRVSVGYEGENGIEANVAYQLNDAGEFINVK